MADREEMSLSFGAVAGAYEAGRPEYPAEAVAWMLEPVRSGAGVVRVADVGAGTGKLTRTLVALGAEVVAIEPDAAMLAVLHDAVPGVPTFVGTAERLPVPDASLDAVVLGQAWHWVDHVAASAEAGRVVRAGGVLGLAWNIRDDSEPWVATMSGIMHSSNAEAMIADGGPEVAAPFAQLETRTWRWSRPMVRRQLEDMVRSRSYVSTAPPEVRDRIESELSTLFDGIGATGDAAVEVPYVTHAFRGIRA